ncbi:MAG: DUF368 domain-containing protein [Planctomycetaceae bacterium]|nr:DUF368 domain-containing protein [Planctomycetaceae bacterium]
MNRSIIETLLHMGRGFLMGGADIIPGVSGGTVALILGIYERLVTAISRFDGQFVRLLRKGQIWQALGRIDAGFLGALGAGILTGIVSLASLMHWLLNEQLEQTFAVFFGLILASSWLVARMVGHWTLPSAALAAAGAFGAFALVGLPVLQSPPTGPLYIFCCGLVAICAMILPGISGSFILLLLGAYADITGSLRAVLHGTSETADILVLVAFCLGCGIGLLGFSRLLKWMLAHYHTPTMAVLCGFMLGSLRKIWPFKEVLNPEATEFKNRHMVNILPDFSAAETWLTVLLMVVAVASILILDAVTRLQHREGVPREVPPASNIRADSTILPKK